MLTELTAQLGPARVVSADGNRVRISMGDREEWAAMALAFPYRPEPGDSVLVAGQDEAWYVIGVLRGRGATAFTAPGDLELRAPNGSVRIVSARGVELEAPEVTIRADRLEIAARSIFERCVQAYRRVTEALHLRAGRIRTAVDESWDLRAERIAERASGDVRIDGEQIHLG
jgi:hypothetical protein